ncbi:amidase family protein [Streptomyces sp. NPDC059697]|uniref:amidase family protein n=1 Tax=Streptomyces sp. NPDC059697 TaxID=3346912 RepID=UPI00369D79A3
MRTLSALTAAVAGGELSVAEVIAGALERLDRTESDVRAWVRVDRDGALGAARELDAVPSGGLLRGVPVGVKDIIDVAGLPTECGSPLRRGRIAEADAPLVARLRRLGAIPLGKTVTTEFAYFAPGPTRNPHNLRPPGPDRTGPPGRPGHASGPPTRGPPGPPGRPVLPRPRRRTGRAGEGLGPVRRIMPETRGLARPSALMRRRYFPPT